MNDELYHYGRLGMKWGQHIFGNKSSGGGKSLPGGLKEKLSSRKKKKQTQELLKKSSRSAQQKPSSKTMTDDELRSRINRMQLEKQYNQLHSELNPTPKSKKQQITDIISKSASRASENLLTQAFNSAGSGVGNKVIRKIITESNNRQDPSKRMSDESLEQFFKEVKLFSNNQKK